MISRSSGELAHMITAPGMTLRASGYMAGQPDGSASGVRKEEKKNLPGCFCWFTNSKIDFL